MIIYIIQNKYTDYSFIGLYINACIYIYVQCKNQINCVQATSAAESCGQHALPICGSLQKLIMVTIKKYLDSEA